MLLTDFCVLEEETKIIYDLVQVVFRQEWKFQMIIITLNSDIIKDV
jgi:hypothetical protein